MSDLEKRDISHEEWREYEWVDPADHEHRVTYRIDHPIDLYYRPNGTTHRIVDESGIAHCVPSVGQLGCVLRWSNPEGPKVNF